MNETDRINHLKDEMIRWAKKLYEKDFLAAADGNLSARVDQQTILITTSGVHKGFLTHRDFSLVKTSGEILEGNPSGEREMHLFVYREVPQCQAVMHAHPPCAISWTIAQPELKELPKECLGELILAVGSVPIIPYARPGTREMGSNLQAFLPKNKAMILSRHGALTWGDNIFEAFCAMERLEHAAKILLYAKSIGSLSNLSESELLHLEMMRKTMGNTVR